MNLNPLRTLAGRMVLVTMLAVLISYAAAFALLTNERGATLRRAAETSVVERVAYAVERIRAAEPEDRASITASLRDFGLRYAIAPAPSVGSGAPTGVAARVGRALSQELAGAEVRARAETVDGPARRWRAHRGGDVDRFAASRRVHRPRDAGPMAHGTALTLSIALAPGAWLNVRARLHGPRPAPISLFIAGLVSVLAVGIGAALISRQIARPLADLATAARALGAGEAYAPAPVRGPEDVRRASSAFNAMAERLGRQMNRQRQMLWALSHDLRTPITALKLRAELIEDDAVRQRLLGPIAEMENLTEQALLLARAGASEEKRSNVDLAEIARTLCGELQDIGIDAQADAPTPVMAECRPSEIARALRNLAENAAKYGGGGVMRVFRAGNGEAIVEIADDGPGVPDDIRARLTDPFFRADSARTATNGAGLGLAIAQAIADGHGGRLELSNRTPRGFSAKLVLPG